MRWMKHHKLLLLPLLLVMLAGCSSAAVSTPKRTAPTPTATSSQASTPVPTPPRSALGPMPTNCPLTAVPGTKVFPKGWGGYLQDATLIGRSPVWGEIPADLQVQVYTGTQGYPDWTGTKILWEVGQGLTQPVTIRVKDLATGVLAWWGEGDQPPSDLVLVLVPYGGNGGDFHGVPT